MLELETLRQYQKRTEYMQDSLPKEGEFPTSAGLEDKVAPDGSFKDFCGDTVIFTLPPEMRSWLGEVCDALYASCGDFLAEPIHPDTFHLTLHDLLNQKERMPDGVDENEPRAMQILAEAQACHPQGVALRSRSAFSMVATSLVMGFEPAEKEDCTILMELYERFQELVYLRYPLTLHVTLAYFKPGRYSEAVLLRLREALQSVGREEKQLRLDMKDLHYARFSSMNNYTIVHADDSKEA